jgi:hypothetical protein
MTFNRAHGKPPARLTASPGVRYSEPRGFDLFVGEPFFRPDISGSKLAARTCRKFADFSGISIDAVLPCHIYTTNNRV